MNHIVAFADSGHLVIVRDLPVHQVVIQHLDPGILFFFRVDLPARITDDTVLIGNACGLGRVRLDNFRFFHFQRQCFFFSQCQNVSPDKPRHAEFVEPFLQVLREIVEFFQIVGLNVIHGAEL